MCGIAGIVAQDAARYRDHIGRMVHALRHRGPDGSGTHFFGDCALGHARLSIVDLATGDQPMRSTAASVGITFNGEIYGYKSLRESLKRSYAFRTSSDTEVILASYLRGGAQWLAALPGMFSFGLWDDTRRELVCARDRFGEKPFYYAFGSGGEFLFASEIKAIEASGLVAPVINPEALAHYMKRLYVHTRQSIYRNVHTLPPAHCLRYSGGRISVERYWSLPEPRDVISMSEAVEEFRRLLDRAVAQQLIADVTVGAFLSGGLDSSTIVAVASRHQKGLQTYSFGFEESASELPYARMVAERYRTEHVELEDRGPDIGELLMAMADVYDEPFADSSNIPTYLIAKLARKHVKVVLTGDGGDELFGGYDFWYKPLAFMEMEAGSPPWKTALHRLFVAVARMFRLPQEENWKSRYKGMSSWSRFGSIAAAHAAQNVFFGDEELRGMGFRARYDRDIPGTGGRLSGTVDDALRMDIEDYMPGDILVKTDRASMAHGLELRAPFLDVDFASFCISLPSRLKVTGLQDKCILREACADAWPPPIRARGKQGFGAPVSKWLKRDSLRALKKKYLDDRGQKIFSLLDFDRTREAVRRDDQRTWILLVLSLWLSRRAFDLPRDG
jgi:asparagine synthase (glutamine-hydrolysing)